jgi:hypothetical protein
MNAASVILSIIGALVVLASVGGGLWAVFRSSAQDSTIKRLRDERDDYLSRLNYIEPRHRAVEQQNELLLAMHNPTEKLDALAGDSHRVLDALKTMHVLIQQIDRSLYREGRHDTRRSEGTDAPPTL